VPYATYAPRISAHATRTGAYRGTDELLWLVIHTSEGGEGETAAENLAAYIATPRTSSNLASYHYVVDTDDVIPIVADASVAYAAAGGNSQGLHICFPGKAGQTIEQWTDEISASYLEQCARWLADKATQYAIPLVKIGPDDLRTGRPGVCGHVDVSLAFKRSTHTDPGKAFPWDKLIARARQLIAPPPVILPLNGELVDSYLDHNGTIYGYNEALNVKQLVPDPDAWNLQKYLRAAAKLDPLPVHVADRTFMRATGPVIGPFPAGKDVDGWGAERI
jgi:hypothetical protein